MIAIDLDGTTIDEQGQASPAVRAELRRAQQTGHHLLVTTGRSWLTTVSVLDHLGVWPEYLVCSNGAVTLRRAPSEPGGYRRIHVTTFDPSPVLALVLTHLPDARIAVETEDGTYRYTHPFPPATTEPVDRQHIVSADELGSGPVARMVVIAPDRVFADFRAIVEGMGLRDVMFTLGWTAWLDIARAGVTKASAAESIRSERGFGRDRVLAVGDGFNDIELLQWAAARGGRGVAMGHAPAELLAAASEVTGSLAEDGLATVLAGM
ncbi:HAD family hydrolase [Microbacterium saperdae]